MTQQNTTLVTAGLSGNQSILMNDTGVTTVYSLGSYTGPGTDVLLNGEPAVWTTVVGGTVTVNPDGTFVYVPPFNFVGIDTYTYNVWSLVTGRVRADVFITVTPISSTVPVTTPDPSVYGTAASVTATVTCGADQAPSVGTVTFRLDGNVIATGVPVINGVATTSLPATLVVGNYTLVAEYSGSTVEPTLCPPSSGSDGHQVVPAPLTVTADPRSKAYGTVATFAGTEFTTDGLLFDDAVDSATLVSPTGAPASATVAGSTYPIVPSAAVGTGLSNYTITYVNGPLTVTPVPLTVTADDKSKVYDGAVFGGPYTVSYSGFVLGEDQTNLGGALTFSGAATTAVNVGTYTDGIVPAGLTSTNYTITYRPGTLAIAPAPLVVTAEDKTKTYDGLVFPGPYTVTYSGFIGGDDPSDLGGALTFSGAATTVVNVGTYTNGIVPAGYTSTNYTITYVSGTLRIDPAVLIVTAEDKSKTYDGLVFPGPYTVTYSGFIGDDDPGDLGGALTFSGVATTAVNGGTYTGGIVPGGYTSSNYTIQYVTGTLTIAPTPLVVTAEDKSKPYDGAVFSPFTVTYSGFVGGDDAGDLGGALTFSGAATTAVNVGTYASSIVPAGYTSSNYTISYEPGTLTITPVPVTVQAHDKTMFEGDPLPTLDGVWTGIVAGDDITAIYTTDATSASAVGEYEILPNPQDPDGALSNYILTIIPGTLTILPLPTDPGSGVCSGGVNRLILKYIGSGSPSGTVSGQRTAPGTGPKVAAQVSGSSPVLYSFATTDMGGLFDPVAGGRMANQFAVFIGNTKIDDVHTSCSVPIYPGMKVGTQFEIVEVWTVGGGSFGPVSTTTTPAPTPTPTPAPAATPTGSADNYTVRRGQTLTVNAPGVLANDAPAAGRTAVLVSNVSRGTLTLNANGSFTYRAQNRWTGNVTFTYAVKVGSVTSAPITVTIVVTR